MNEFIKKIYIILIYLSENSIYVIIKNYIFYFRVRWSEPVNVSLKTDTLFSVKPPGSGAILGLILGILNNYNFNKNSISDEKSTITTYHRIIEAFKFAYAQRTLLGDEDFVNVTDVSTY